MASPFRSFLCAAALFTLFCPMNDLLAQDARGKIVGRVLDSSSALVPGADVVATQVAMNVHVDAKSNSDGNYTLPFLLPGIYRIDVKAPGFKEYTRHPIEVRVGDTVTLDITLALGNVTEKMDVVAEASSWKPARPACPRLSSTSNCRICRSAAATSCS